MADLPFLEKLDKNQLEIADKIITKAQEMGVDPRLALSLAYVESGLKMDKVGDAGEIGVMQIKPNTGKMFGVDEKGLRDRDTNIGTGLQYLKQGIERYKDPQLGVVAYNAGHDAPFLLGKSEAPPESTLSYVNKINDLGGFTPTAQPEGGDGGGSGGAAPKPKPKEDVVPASESDYRSTLAAATGAGLGGSAGAVKTLFPGGAKGAQAPTMTAGAPSAPSAAPVKAGAGLPPAGGAHVPTPAGGKGTLNYGKAVLGLADIDAARAANYGDAWKVAQQVGEAEKKIGPGWKMQPDRANILLDENVGSGPRGAKRVPVPPVQVKPPSMSQKAVSGLQGAGNFLTQHRILGGALAGAGAGFGGQEAYDRYKRGDVLGAGIAGVGALGSLASAIPHPLTRGIGTAVGMASPLALSVLDRIHNQPAPQQPQQ